MKTLLASFVILAGLTLFSGGCAATAYSANERQQLIDRNQGIESLQVVDDWDSIWLTRPASHLTLWHVQ